MTAWLSLFNSKFSLSSHGRRSASVRGVPARILATFSGGWNSSASRNRQPSRSASSLPMVLLPAPETPITTSITGAGSRSFMDCVAPEALAHHGDQLAGAVGAALAGEARHQRGGDHRRRHAELDRLERRPAPRAGIVDHRRDAGQAVAVLQDVGA